jgi:hypothetical protein
MIGAQSEIHTLNAANNSLGLTKNIQVTSDVSTVELTQGITNDLVMSVPTKRNLSASFEVYEFTAKNIAYGLGLQAGSGYAPISTQYPLAGNVAAAATTLTITGDQTTTFVAGKWGFIQKGSGDVVHVFKVISSSYSAPNTTVTFTGYAVPTGVSFSNTVDRVGLFNKIDADATTSNNVFSMKIVGTAIDNQTPVMLVFPRVKITKGFAFSFNTENFANLPFEVSPYAPVPTDTGYADYPTPITILRQ